MHDNHTTREMHACAKLRTKNPFVQLSLDRSTEREKKNPERRTRAFGECKTILSIELICIKGYFHFILCYAWVFSLEVISRKLTQCHQLGVLNTSARILRDPVQTYQKAWKKMRIRQILMVFKWVRCFKWYKVFVPLEWI